MNLLPAGHRAPALWLLLPLLSGLVAGRALDVPLPTGPLLAAAGIALVVAAIHPRAWALALPLGIFALGLVFHDLVRNRLNTWDALPPREALVEVEVSRVFGPSPDGRKINGLARIVATEAHLADLAGQRIYFSLSPGRSPAVERGSRLAARGVLERLPDVVMPGSFEHYLDATGVNFLLRRGVIEREVRAPSVYRRACAAALARFDAILGNGLADKPAMAGIYRAMLLGRKSELTDEQDDLFLRSGTLHLFAISGLHIATMAAALHVVLAFAPAGRWVRFLAATALLWLYTDVTGASPSAVRAFLMATLISALPVLRLPGNTPAALAVSACIALVADPMQAFGAGFQMSYGIVTALLLLGLPLSDAWLRRPTSLTALPRQEHTRIHRLWTHARRLMITSVCLGAAATVIGTVSGIAFFQLLTPGAFGANLVLIPLASLVVIAGCASLLCGYAGLAGFSIVFNHAAALLLWLIERSVRLVVELPGASFPARFHAPWIGPAALLLLVGLMMHGYSRQWRPAAGGYWPPFVLLAVVLVAGVQYG